MKREIKFRVWDEDNSIMLHDDGREQVDISFYGGRSAVVHHFTEHTIEREGIEMDVPVSDQVTNFILMQYTGLKDRNGKEIYEEDIIQDNVGRYWVIRYDNKFCAFMFYYTKGMHQFQHYERFNKFQRPFEIIGNNFENPGFLTDK